MRLVLVGPPGAGKGTQAEFIAKRYGIPKISTGDIFRANVSGGTELGREAKKYMDAGDLVPDEVTNAMVRDRLAEPDATAGFLLDGFPRNTAQAEVLDGILDQLGSGLSVVLDLEVDFEEVVRRLSGRRTCKKCGHVWHLEFDPPTQRGRLRPLRRRAVPARRRSRRHRPPPARGVRAADRADHRLLPAAGGSGLGGRPRRRRGRLRAGVRRARPARRLGAPPCAAPRSRSSSRRRSSSR